MDATGTGRIGARSREGGLDPARVEAHLLARDAVLLDVREPRELREQGWIAGCVHAPPGASAPSGLDPDRPIIVCCDTGHRSALVADRLRGLGHRDVAHLEGGLRAWVAAGLPVAGLERWHRGVSVPAAR